MAGPVQRVSLIFHTLQLNDKLVVMIKFGKTLKRLSIELHRVFVEEVSVRSGRHSVEFIVEETLV